MLISYICLTTFKASSASFIASKNFGLSGKKWNINVLIAFTDAIKIIYSRHGTNLINIRLRLQFIGIKNMPINEEYMKIIGINIETNEAALGAVSLV